MGLMGLMGLMGSTQTGGTHTLDEWSKFNPSLEAKKFSRSVFSQFNSRQENRDVNLVKLGGS